MRKFFKGATFLRLHLPKKFKKWLTSYPKYILLVVLFTILVNFLFEFRFTVSRRPWWDKNPGNSVSQDLVLPEKPAAPNKTAVPTTTDPTLEKEVLPSAGVVLPVKWGNLGQRLVDNGVIDRKKLEQIYQARGGLNEEAKKLLESGNNGHLKMTAENSGFLLNLLWAFGLANKNPVLEKGPMQDPQYGGAGNFASTGGWSLAQGKAMDHYAKYPLVTLNGEQQALVERVAKNIYRPCCGNSTYFPDCNHGMAMLGLLELLAAQNISEKEMYRLALYVNSYWFPDTYLTIAQYLQNKGTPWANVNPQEILGANFSSGQGYQRILSEVSPVQPRGGGGCGV